MTIVSIKNEKMSELHLTRIERVLNESQTVHIYSVKTC